MTQWLHSPSQPWQSQSPLGFYSISNIFEAPFRSGTFGFVQKRRVDSKSFSLGESRVEGDEAHLLENRSRSLREGPSRDEISPSQENRRCAQYTLGYTRRRHGKAS